jgi:hypothetical protein
MSPSRAHALTPHLFVRDVFAAIQSASPEFTAVVTFQPIAQLAG